jgi:hypothetical protein
MRVGASSGGLVGVGSVAVEFVVAFMMFLGLIPRSSGFVLLGTFAVISVLAFSGAWTARHTPELTARKPLVRLEIRRDSHSPSHSYVVAMNDGDLAAINVSGTCVLVEGDFNIEFGPANVGATSTPTLIPMKLVSGGRRLQTRNPPFSEPPAECEFTTGTMQAFLSAAQGEFTVTVEDGGQRISPIRPEPLARKFNITYTDPSKRERYSRAHILRYWRGEIRIDVDEAPDPPAITRA